MSFEHLVGKVFRVVKHPHFFKNELVYAASTDDKPGKDPARVRVLLIRVLMNSSYQHERRINAQYLSDPSHFTPFSHDPIVPGSRFSVTCSEHARTRGGLVSDTIIVVGEHSASQGGKILPFYDCTQVQERFYAQGVDGTLFPDPEGKMVRTSKRLIVSLLHLLDPCVYTRLRKASVPKLSRIVSRKPRVMIPRVRESSVRVKNREEIIAGIMAGLEKLPPRDQQEVIFSMMAANRGMGLGVATRGIRMLSHCHFEDRRPASAR